MKRSKAFPLQRIWHPFVSKKERQDKTDKKEKKKKRKEKRIKGK